MPNVMVDTAFPDSDDTMRLCRMLNEPCADALPLRLWCWGIESNRVNGRFEASAKQLAQIVRFHGDPQTLLDAFLSCNVIEKTPESSVFRICGWKRNARYFKERDRLRAYSSTKKPRVDHASGTQTPRANHKDPSSSSSSVVSKETTTAAVVVLEGADDEPKKREIRSTRGLPESAFAAEFAMGGEGAGVKVAVFDDLERSIAGKLIKRCGEEKITQAQLFAEWWRPEWRQWHGCTVIDLGKHFAKVRAAIADPKLRPKLQAKPEDQKAPGWRAIPSADETTARIKADRAKAEAIANDPEEQAGIARIQEDLRMRGLM